MKSNYKFSAILIMMIGVITTASICYIQESEKIEIREVSTLGKRSITTQKEKTEIKAIPYNEDGVSAQYPEFVQGGSEEQLNAWNRIIQNDFHKILKIYSFKPILEPTPVKTGNVPTILKIKYEIKANNNKYFSVLWNADYNSPYSAHPTDLVYTTNIDKAKSRSLKLSDMVILNNNFVKNFRSWEFKSIEENNEELNQAIKDYVMNISDEDLLKGFQSADILGSGNAWGIYSYLTDDRLGISLGVPNYAGDHVEFEREYSKLNGYLKTHQ